MANSAKAVVILGIIIVFLQVSSCTAGRYVPGNRAVMSLTGFQKGDKAGGWGPTCNHKYLSNDLFVVSLTSGWYSNGLRCGKMIRIQSNLGLAVEAMVVDRCDVEEGCGGHEIGTSAAVWKALGVDPRAGIGRAFVSWSDLS